MISVVDERLRREARVCNLKFACEDCAHHDASADCCSLGYPDGPHRGIVLDEVSELWFCKYFELS